MQLSATFAVDHVAFAFALGPLRVNPGNVTVGNPARGLRRGLFRSDDAGLTWHSLTRGDFFDDPFASYYDGGERLALSPFFAQDHFALLWSIARDAVGRGPGYCEVHATWDGGETWTKVTEGGTRSYLDYAPSCFSLAIGGPPGDVAALLGLIKATGAMDWVVATNKPPANAGLPPDTLSLAQVRVISAAKGASGTVVAVSPSGDLWTLGP